MRIASISLVKDEADILEAFLRHNLHFVDRMYVIDDRSTDNTAEILKRITEETSAVRTLDDGWTGAFHQARRTTAALKRVIEDDDWDVVLALDADELICAADRAVFESDISAIPSRMVGGFTAIHYFATGADDPSIAEPLVRVRTALPLSEHLFKSFAVGPFDASFAFSDGNHQIERDGITQSAHILPNAALAHFAIRSPDLIAIKCLKHYVGWRSRSDYNELLSIHLIRGARALKEEPSFALSPSSGITGAYLGLDVTLARDRPFTERRGAIKWPELATISPYAQLLGVLDQLIEKAKWVDADATGAFHSTALRDLQDLKGSTTKLFKAYATLTGSRLKKSIKKRIGG